jgi:putative thioredoxin
MRRDRKWGDDLGRKSLVQAFPLIIDEDLIGQTRRRMSSLLF